MLMKNDYPILEFDDNRDAKINPTTWVDKKFECNKMVITFFPEVVDKLIADGMIVLEKTIDGENIVLIYRFVNTDILITLGAVGCPSCAGNLDLFNAMGVEKVMFCGGGGVLDRNIEVGQLLVVDGAIRDEGFSYHYIKPSKYIYTDKNVTDKIVQYLKANNISYIQGLTWTTDAIFRETADRIAQRKIDGAKIVEMEQAGLLTFTPSVSEWIEQTGAIGLFVKKGRYGGTFAHKDIAFEFASAISPVFKLYLIKEFQRLKEEENELMKIEWDAKRFLSKNNYLIQTDAVKNYLVPTCNYREDLQWLPYAEEADFETHNAQMIREGKTKEALEKS